MTATVPAYLEWLPHINAALNTLSTVLLCIGFAMIRMGRKQAHRRAMTAAIATSAAFLVTYVIYHFNAPVFAFPGQGWVRPLYFTMLASHVVLATAITPLAIMTAVRAYRGYKADPSLASVAAFAPHKKVARWTLPIWLYVTVTGVAVYLILYQVYGLDTSVQAS